MAEQYGVMSEHEKFSTEEAPAGYNPTSEEKKAIKLAQRLFDKARTHRKKYDREWLDNYKFFRGKQWKDMRPSYRHSEVFNFIYQTIESQVAILSDPRPKFEFLPEEPQDRELAEILNEAAQSDWEKKNWAMLLAEVLYDAEIYGIGYGSMMYDPKQIEDLDKIVFKAEDPFYCFPDPNAVEPNTNARFFVHAEPREVEIVRAEYPDKADFIKADIIDIMDGDRTALTTVKYKSPTDSRSVIEGSPSNDNNDSNKVLYVCVYIMDDSEIEEEKDQEGQFVKKKKYPCGRKIVLANNVLLSDGPLGYDDCKAPFGKMVNTVLPHEYYGVSEMEPLKGPQKAFNKLMSFAMDYITLMGNPVWIVDYESDVDVDNLYNRPGLVVQKTKGSEVRREQGVPINPDLYTIGDRIKTYIDTIAGSPDVTRGIKPEGVQAASAIGKLQEAAQTRLRKKSRYLDAFLQVMGQMWLSRLFQFTTAPRIFRLTNNEGGTKYFRMSVNTPLDDSGQPLKDEKGLPKRMVRVSNYEDNPETGQLSESEIKEFELRGKFDVRVTTGSTLGFEKDRRMALAKDLFDRKAIDEEELLKSVEWPNFEAVLERMRARAAEAAQAEATSSPQPS